MFLVHIIVNVRFFKKSLKSTKWCQKTKKIKKMKFFVDNPKLVWYITSAHGKCVNDL